MTFSSAGWADAPCSLRFDWPMTSMRCDYCGQDGSIHYRIRTAASVNWRFACPECWKVQSQQPQYQYGGTRKANRRQR